MCMASSSSRSSLYLELRTQQQFMWHFCTRCFFLKICIFSTWGIFFSDVFMMLIHVAWTLYYMSKHFVILFFLWSVLRISKNIRFYRTTKSMAKQTSEFGAYLISLSILWRRINREQSVSKINPEWYCAVYRNCNILLWELSKQI